MASKVCPRCGTQFEKMKSATCPQCFARLVEVDDELAAELSAARAEVESTPEFQEVKAQDDERFRQQSFGACLGVIALFVATMAVMGVMLITSARREHTKPRAPARPVAAAPATPALNDILTPRPVGGAPMGDVLPASLGQFHRTALDQDIVLPGTFTPIFHAAYSSGTDPKAALQVYAIPTGRSTDEQNEFRLGVTLSAQVQAGGQPRMAIFASEHWRYAVVETGANPSGDLSQAFKNALADAFKS